MTRADDLAVITRNADVTSPAPAGAAYRTGGRVFSALPTVMDGVYTVEGRTYWVDTVYVPGSGPFGRRDLKVKADGAWTLIAEGPERAATFGAIAAC